ncbi:MAG: glycosyltransferase family 2 protein [Flavobacteriales bacterium]
MVLSITICTYNRIEYLKKCLKSVLDQTQGKKSIEINIIDNNSTDNTKGYISEIKKKYPEVNYYVEHKQGISFARNLSFEVCKGMFLAFVDDDAVINKNWLEALLNELKNQNENIIYGGPIYPNFESNPEDWIDKDYFIRKFKDTDGFLGTIKSKEGFSGGNMCIAKNLFLKSEKFNTEIGMTGGNLGLGEEPDFFYKLIMKNKDVKLYNISEMSITHSEASYKLEKEYLRDRIILNANQFTKRTIFHENFLMTTFILLSKLVIQSTKLFISLFLHIIRRISPGQLSKIISPTHKFKFLKSYWVIRGIFQAIS